jgi:hypothetical protein
MADTPLTISPLRVTPLSEQERAATGFSVKYKVLYSDIAYGTGATDTVTLTLSATPTNWYIDKALVRIGTAFVGITVASIIVGTTTSTAALISSTSILTNTTATAAKNITATFTAAGTGGPAGLTAGELTIYLNVQNVAELP